MRLRLVVFAFGLVAISTAAHADPCKAISDDGTMPSYLSVGSTFSGKVVHVIDGDSMCIAVGAGHENWVEVRLTDFYAPESSSAGGPAAKAALERIALGKNASCVAGLRTYDRVAARCSIDGQGVGDQMHRAGVKEGGRAYRGEGDFAPISPRSSTSSGMSCAELRARGGARRGEPGYRAEWDGDGDGIACEPYRRR